MELTGDKRTRYRSVITGQGSLLVFSAISARIVQTIGILVSGLGFGAAYYNSAAKIGPRAFHILAPASALAQTAFYFTRCASALCTCLLNLATGRIGETVVPCMNKMWCEVLNVVIIVLAINLFILTALETKIWPNGKVITDSVNPPPIESG